MLGEMSSSISSPFTLSIDPDCHGHTSTCPCGDCTRLTAFKSAPWYFNQHNSHQMKPFVYNNDPLPTDFAEAPLRAHYLGITEEIGKLDTEILHIQKHLSK